MTSLAPDDFAKVSAVERLSPTVFRARVPDGWQQGRGAFGGLVLGILTRAMEANVDDRARVLRSITGELPGPVMPGETEIHVASLREGSGMSFLEARLIHGDQVLARATGVFGKTRVTDREVTRVADAPPPPPWPSVTVVPMGPPMAPAFSQHFEFRMSGPPPFAGGTEPVAEGWIRPKATLASWGCAEVVAMADAWWPTMFAVETQPRPTATVGFTLQFLLDPASLSPAEPLFHRARAVAGHDGFIVEHRSLWTPDGRLVAMNDQTFVIIK